MTGTMGKWSGGWERRQEGGPQWVSLIPPTLPQTHTHRADLRQSENRLSREGEQQGLWDPPPPWIRERFVRKSAWLVQCGHGLC